MLFMEIIGVECEKHTYSVSRKQGFSLHKNVHTGSGTHPSSYSMGTGVISQG
jgi:hypothetical protein